MNWNSTGEVREKAESAVCLSADAAVLVGVPRPPWPGTPMVGVFLLASTWWLDRGSRRLGA